MKKVSFESQFIMRSRAVANSLALALSLGMSAFSAVAGVTLQVNGGTNITVNGGETLSLEWTATDDVTYLRRSWGTSYETQLPGALGAENIHAPNPSTVVRYGYVVNGYDAAQQQVQAVAYVTVLPNPNAPAATPIVWTPPLGFYQHSILSFCVLPDAEIGTPYSAILSATGREPITYSAVNLPDGLAVVGNTVAGTPTSNAWVQGGNFTLIATDADGFMSATLARMMTPVLYPRVLTPVTAPVVFDGGTAELGGAYVNDPSSGLERAASGFTLKNASTVTGVRVWGTYLARFKAGTDHFSIRFYDHGPSPIGPLWASFPAAGNLIGTFTPTSVTRSKTGRASYDVPDSEYVHELGFSGITLQSNTLYYVCVDNDTQGEKWAWASSTIQNYPSWGAYSQDGVTFPGGSFELAFQLLEGPIVQPPPPTTVTNTYKLAVKTNGKGTTSFTPQGSGSSGNVYAPGTVVTITASPDPTDPKSIWKGWTGDVVSSSRTITVIMSRNISVQANFR